MDERLARKGERRKLSGINLRRKDGQRKFPEINKVILLTLSVVLLFAANFRFGFSVSVAGKKLAGVYAPKELLAAVNAAEAAACEITGNELNLRDSFEIMPRLTMGEYSPDKLAIERALLDSAPGIKRLCAVRVDGEFLGWVMEQSEFAEILGSLLAERCTGHTVSAGFTKKITAQYSYAPSDVPYSAMEISRIIRDMDIIQVIDLAEDAAQVSSDGIIW